MRKNFESINKEEENHENKLLKLFKNRAHHWCNINEWTRSNYHYLTEKFSQDEKYTEETTQAASTLWTQWT